MSDNKLFKNISVKYILLVFFVIGFILRFYLIPQNLFFGPEQGIDFLSIHNIVANYQLTLIGSKTDIEGVFHGPFYYYLAMFPFLLSKGSPVVVISFFILFHAFSAITIYFLGKELYSKRVGLISSFIYTFSYAAIVYSRWLANPPLSLPFSILFFLFLIRFIKGDNKSLLLTALMAGLLGQSEFINFIFFIPILIVAFLINIRRFKQVPVLITILSFVIFVLFSFGTYLIFDIRHQYLISKSLINLLTGNTGYYVSYSNSFLSGLLLFGQTFNDYILGYNHPMVIFEGIAFIIVCIYYVMRRKKYSYILLLWTLLPVIILIILHHALLPHFFISIAGGYILGWAYLIDLICQKNIKLGFIILAGVTIGSIIFYIQTVPLNQNIYFQTTQPEFVYSKQLKAIDAIYKNSQKESFAYEAYTIPYAMDQGWKYLFQWYGNRQYGYQPTNKNYKNFYIIIQHDSNNEKRVEEWVFSKKGSKQSQSIWKEGILEVQKIE